MTDEKMCATCPFTGSKAAIQRHTGGRVDGEYLRRMAAECASQVQLVKPHPCLEIRDVISEPAVEGERVCVGHRKWLRGQVAQ